jgi:hypothetical protein
VNPRSAKCGMLPRLSSSAIVRLESFSLMNGLFFQTGRSYHRRLLLQDQGMADGLYFLGEELPHRYPFLQLLCGLNKKYDHMKALIKRTESMPSFHTVQNDLEL